MGYSPSEKACYCLPDVAMATVPKIPNDRPRDRFLAAGQAGLKSRATEAVDDDHRRLQAKIGELLMETELLYAKVDQLEAGRPLARRRSTQ